MIANETTSHTIPINDDLHNNRSPYGIPQWITIIPKSQLHNGWHYKILNDSNEKNTLA